MILESLLNSDDIETRHRAMKLLSSYFLTSPDSILENFTEYFSFFSSLYFNRNTDSISFYEYTGNLLQIVSHKIEIVTDEVGHLLLKYFVLVAKSFNEASKIDAFALPLLDIAQLHKSILLLMNHMKLGKDLAISFVEILSILDDQELLVGGAILSNIDLFAQAIVDTPSSFTNILKCLQSMSNGIMKFGCDVLLKATKKSKEITELLLPYLSFVQSRIAFDKEESLQLLYDELSKKYYDSTLSISHQSTINHIFSNKILLPEYFNSEFNNIVQIIKSPSAPKRKIKTKNDRLSGSDASSTSDGHKNGKRRSSVHQNYLIQQNLVENVFKLGGFQHSAWQPRKVSFYPSNKSLIWESTKEIKGVLFLKHTTQLEAEYGTLKGKNNVLKIITPTKTHEIAFGYQEKLDIWYKALSEVIKQ